MSMRNTSSSYELYAIMRKWSSKARAYCKAGQHGQGLQALLAITLAAYRDDHWWGDTDDTAQPVTLVAGLARLWQTVLAEANDQLGIQMLARGAIEKLLMVIKTEWEEQGPGMGCDLKFPWNKPKPQTKPQPPKQSSAMSSGFIDPALRQRLCKAITAAVKKVEHRERNKPVSAVEMVVVSDVAKQLLGTQLSKMVLTAKEAIQMLGLPTVVHPVRSKFNCTWGGSDSRCYAWAGYDSIELSYVKKTQTLKVKTKTFYVGSGDPRKCSDMDENTYNGYVECASPNELKAWLQEKELTFGMAMAKDVTDNMAKGVVGL